MRQKHWSFHQYSQMHGSLSAQHERIMALRALPRPSRWSRPRSPPQPPAYPQSEAVRPATARCLVVTLDPCNHQPQAGVRDEQRRLGDYLKNNENWVSFALVGVRALRFLTFESLAANWKRSSSRLLIAFLVSFRHYASLLCFHLFHCISNMVFINRFTW